MLDGIWTFYVTRNAREVPHLLGTFECRGRVINGESTAYRYGGEVEQIAPDQYLISLTEVVRIADADPFEPWEGASVPTKVEAQVVDRGGTVLIGGIFARGASERGLNLTAIPRSA